MLFIVVKPGAYTLAALWTVLSNVSAHDRLPRPDRRLTSSIGQLRSVLCPPQCLSACARSEPPHSPSTAQVDPLRRRRGRFIYRNRCPPNATPRLVIGTLRNARGPWSFDKDLVHRRSDRLSRRCIPPSSSHLHRSQGKLAHSGARAHLAHGRHVVGCVYYPCCVVDASEAGTAFATTWGEAR